MSLGLRPTPFEGDLISGASPKLYLQRHFPHFSLVSGTRGLALGITFWETEFYELRSVFACRT